MSTLEKSMRRRRVAVMIALVASSAAIIALATTGGEASASHSDITARQFHASPNGEADADGSVAHPLSLGRALSGQSPVLPGDTLWLHGGIYHGPFTSELRGTERAPILVRQAAGERATIDGGATSISEPALYVKGAWTTYWGFEVMSSDPSRVLEETGSQPVGLKRGTGIDVHAPHSRFVNLVVHDAANGIGLWSDAEEAEAYGNLVYYNGWSAADRSHGHGIYTQNEQGVRRVSENIIFSQFSHGIHAYGSDAASLDHIELTGNVVFNNGALDRSYYDRNILLGGARSAAAPVLDSNYTYYTPLVRHGGENNVGYNGGCVNLIARNNYFAGQVRGGVPLRLADRCSGVIAGNVFYGAMEPAIATAYPDNAYLSEPPTGLKVFVRPNRYDPSRAHVVVYNWDRLPEVTIDLSALSFDPGAVVELRDAQDYFGEPAVAQPLLDGRITVPMRGARPAAPVGNLATPRHTQPEFAVFVAIGTPRRHRLRELAASTLEHAQRMWGQLWER
jgi:hypothetical protein